jgi:hypothetical protein
MQEQALFSKPFSCLMSLLSLFHHMSNLPSNSPLSSTILVHKKGIDLKNLRSTKKKEEMWWRRAHVHKKKRIIIFCSLTRKISMSFPRKTLLEFIVMKLSNYLPIKASYLCWSKVK